MTNGDGVTGTNEEDSVRRVARRRGEALRSLGTAGVSESQVRFLGHSEVEIYRNLAKLRWAPLRLSEVAAFFEPVRQSVAEAVYEFRPDVAFAVGFQGGNPEHDLAHFFASLALRAYGRDGETNVPLYQFPEYELTILLPMRFRPWYPGEKYWIDLSPEELTVKQAMAACYSSQRSQMKRLRMVVGLLTLPQRIVRRKTNPIHRFFSREQLSRVPEDFNYQKSPYRIDFLNNLFENSQGIPLTFQDCMRPLLLSFEDRLNSPPEPS
jgi:LmbE family N-acetylglucosaminyl deacetylase